MSLTKLSLGGNNDVIYKLFPPRESLVSDIPAGDGNIEKLFLQCNVGLRYIKTFAQSLNYSFSILLLLRLVIGIKALRVPSHVTTAQNGEVGGNIGSSGHGRGVAPRCS